MCTNSEGSGETARMRRLAWAFAGRLCDKYHNLMSWLIWEKKKKKQIYTICSYSARNVFCDETIGRIPDKNGVFPFDYDIINNVIEYHL